MEEVGELEAPVSGASVGIAEDPDLVDYGHVEVPRYS
jgi:hypothetical protein